MKEQTFCITRGTICNYYALWSSMPRPILVGRHDEHVLFEEKDDCVRLVQAFYGLDILFPKLKLDKGNWEFVKVTETETGYVIEKVDRIEKRDKGYKKPPEDLGLDK